jgi:hypothetical protein
LAENIPLVLNSDQVKKRPAIRPPSSSNTFKKSRQILISKIEPVKQAKIIRAIEKCATQKACEGKL